MGRHAAIAGSHPPGARLGTKTRRLGSPAAVHLSAHDLYETGRALRAAGRLEEAADAYRQALELDPALAEAANNLGNCLRMLWRLDEAESAYRAALAARPDYGEAWNNLGAALKNLGRTDEAVVCFERAVALRPGDPALHSNLIFTRLYASSDDPALVQAEEKRWNLRHAEPLREGASPLGPDRPPNRPLRIGFVSACFREHAQSFFTIPLFEHLDRTAFSIFAYSDVARPDGLTERLRRYCAEFRSIAGRADADVAALIRADQIDILVDLTLHMPQNRLLVFARRAAPVQISWLGYPGSTGLAAMDYRLTDPWLDPPGNGDRLYAERSWRLPHTFWCYDPLADGPAVSPLPALSRDGVTFGCLNNFSKTNPATFALWGQVIRAVPNSRLRLMAPPGSARHAALAALGVGEGPVEFVDFQPRAAYLESYGGIDLCLDTFPYNGHTTSLDSWWMGVPVVSLRGRTVVSRAGYSQSMNLGLPEFAAESAEAFVSMAVSWASDKPRLASLRAGLRERMSRSPLMDASCFARAFGDACRTLWDRRETGVKGSPRGPGDVNG